MRKFTIPILIAIAGTVLAGAFGAGAYIGYSAQPETAKVNQLANIETPADLSDKTDFTPYWKVWNLINEKFAGPAGTSTKAITPQQKVWKSISGLVDSLEDPYSTFLPPDDAKIFEENIQGSFGGVGMEIGMRDSQLTVVSPLKGTPAEKAGLQSGDAIIGVDGKSTADMSVDEAVKIIRGKVGTEVVLTIRREGKDEPFEVPIIRDTIQIPTINTKIESKSGSKTAQQGGQEDPGAVRGDVFIISLYNFSAQSAQKFQEALREFVLTDTNNLIIDLRGNAGGFLQAAVNIASWFIPAGETIVTEDFSDDKEDIVYRSKGYGLLEERDIDIVVLVNRGSASAAEILAGALREHGVATLVGETTFGKGSVQELIEITPDSSLKLTVAHWLTPDGNLISKGGITPDVEVKMTAEDVQAGEDPQLEKAIELLTQ